MSLFLFPHYEYREGKNIFVLSYTFSASRTRPCSECNSNTGSDVHSFIIHSQNSLDSHNSFSQQLLRGDPKMGRKPTSVPSYPISTEQKPTTSSPHGRSNTAKSLPPLGAGLTPTSNNSWNPPGLLAESPFTPPMASLRSLAKQIQHTLSSSVLLPSHLKGPERSYQR